MIIAHSHRFIFIKTKKTAGTSIEVYLSPLLEDEDVVTPVGMEEATADHRPRNYRGRRNTLGEAFGLIGAPTQWKRVDGGGALRSVGHMLKGKAFYNHISAYRAKGRVGPETWNSYFTFAVERNPWDKAISQYYWKARRRPGYTFDAFVKEGDPGVNHPRYCHPITGEIMVDRIIYYHRLNQELGELFAELGIPYWGSLDVHAKSTTRRERKPYQELFLGELAPYRKAIETLCAREIELHGWDFDSGLAKRATT